MSADFDTRLLDLLYGELSPEDAKALEAELSEDAAAQQTLQSWSRVREAVKDLPVPEPDPQVHYTILRAAREAVEPAKPKGFWAWLSGVALNPAFAGVAMMALAVGSVMFFQLNEDAPESALDKAAAADAPSGNVPPSSVIKPNEQAVNTPGFQQAVPRSKSAAKDRLSAGGAGRAAAVDLLAVDQDDEDALQDANDEGAIAQRGFAGRGRGLDVAKAESDGKDGTVVGQQLDHEAEKSSLRFGEADRRTVNARSPAKGFGAGGPSSNEARTRAKKAPARKKGPARKKSRKRKTLSAKISAAAADRPAQEKSKTAVGQATEESAEPRDSKSALSGVARKAEAKQAEAGKKKAEARGRRSRVVAKPAPRPAPASRAEPGAPETLSKSLDVQFAPPPPDIARRDERGPQNAKADRAAGDTGDYARDRAQDGVPVAALRERKEEVALEDKLAPPAAPVVGDMDTVSDDEAVERVAVTDAPAPIVAKATVAPQIVVPSPRRAMPANSGAAQPMGDSFDLSAGGAAAPPPSTSSIGEPESRRTETLQIGGAGSAAPAQPAEARPTSTPPLLNEARAARARGDHRAAVGAYARYFQRHPGDSQFSRGIFEAAASHEALGQKAQAIRLYGLIPSTAGQLYARAQARIGALNAAQVAPEAKAKAAEPAAEADDERSVVDPMPQPPNVEPPR